jgi:hypothetical protein
MFAESIYRKIERVGLRSMARELTPVIVVLMLTSSIYGQSVVVTHGMPIYAPCGTYISIGTLGALATLGSTNYLITAGHVSCDFKIGVSFYEAVNGNYIGGPGALSNGCYISNTPVWIGGILCCDGNYNGTNYDWFVTVEYIFNMFGITPYPNSWS